MTNEKDTPIRLAVHAIMPRTETNGPGVRFGIWVQGCSKRCPGCFNPEALHVLSADAAEFKPPNDPGWMAVGDLLELIEEVHDRSPLDGISISGGEPFDQAAAMKFLFTGVRGMGLSVLVFTGYTKEELVEDSETRFFLEPEPIVDVLVDGPYDRTQPVEGELRGSANQNILLLTDRYTPDDLVPPGPIECVIQPDGSVSVTGFSRAPFQDMPGRKKQIKKKETGESPDADD